MRVRVLIPPLVAMLLGLALMPGSAAAQADVVGQWRMLPQTAPINPIHVTVLRSGKILIASGSENDPTHTTFRAAVYDWRAGTFVMQNVPWDFFCNAMSQLPDGRILITGGNLQYNPFRGLKTTTIFDPATEKFIQVQDMAHGRWYPSNATLADGRTMVFGGTSESGGINRAVEFYDVGTGWSPEFLAPFTPPLYPWLHLLPNGTIFHSGYFGASRFFDPATRVWTNGPMTVYGGNRRFGSSVLLPLRPEEGYRPRVMIMGGNDPATATAEIIDLGAATPAWRSLPDMSAPRIEMNAVLLPTGKVLALGGSREDNVASTASLDADLFDPATETWSPAGRGAVPRLYHSVALLLPDATVWVAGSNPFQGNWDNRMEIYSPAYLFTRDASGQSVPAPRPSITSAPTRLGYNAPFTVSTPNPADIASVVLIRPGSNTHAFDFEQRLVGLTFTAGAGSLSVTAPSDTAVAPPGHYMLFLINRAGTPSVARFIQLAPAPENQPPRGTITAPAADVTIKAGQSVSFAGDATDADGSVVRFSWIFPGGSPGTSTARVPGAVTFATPGRYTVSLTAVDDRGANDPSPPTRMITVNESLKIALTSPSPGASVKGTVWASIWVEAPGGTAPYQYSMSAAGAPIGTPTSSANTHVTLPWDTTKTPNGPQTLTVTVRDADGKVGTGTVNVTVQNGPAALAAAITSPAEGATVSGNVTVGLSASGGSPNYTFQLKIDGRIVLSQNGPGTTASFTWDTTAESNASHTLELTVSDGAGATATARRTVTVNNAPPTGGLGIALTSPSPGATVKATVWASIWVQAPGGTAPYQYSMSAAGAAIGTPTSSSNTHVTLPWDTTKTPNGPQTLTVTVRDAAGKSGTGTVNVTVQNGPAALAAGFTSPAAGATVSATVTVGMTATGGTGPYAYGLSLDGAQIFSTTGASTSASHSWNTTTASNGSHTLDLTVTDSAGATATARRSVTVSNGPPTGDLRIALTSPNPGATVKATTWASIWVEAPAGTPPYQYTMSAAGATVWTASSSNTHVTLPWDTTKTPNGPQTLTVTVRDADGRVGTGTVSVTVQNP